MFGQSLNKKIKLERKTSTTKINQLIRSYDLKIKQVQNMLRNFYGFHRFMQTVKLVKKSYFEDLRKAGIKSFRVIQLDNLISTKLSLPKLKIGTNNLFSFYCKKAVCVKFFDFYVFGLPFFIFRFIFEKISQIIIVNLIDISI